MSTIASICGREEDVIDEPPNENLLKHLSYLYFIAADKPERFLDLNNV